MSDEVVVLSRTQIINVEPTSGRITVTNAGPVGPPGANGSDGLWRYVPETHYADLDLSITTDLWEINIQPNGDHSTYIDIYDNGSISYIDFRAEEDFNFNADRDFNLQTDNDINLWAHHDMNILSDHETSIDSATAVNIGIFRESPIWIGNATMTGDITFQTGLSDVSFELGRDFNVETARDILMTSGHDLSLNSGTAYGIFLQAGTGMKLDAGLDALELDTSAGNDIKIGETVSGGDIHLGYGGGGSTFIKRDGGSIDITVDGGNVLMHGLPTSDPGIVDALYVDGSGFVKKSL